MPKRINPFNHADVVAAELRQRDTEVAYHEHTLREYTRGAKLIRARRDLALARYGEARASANTMDVPYTSPRRAALEAALKEATSRLRLAEATVNHLELECHRLDAEEMEAGAGLRSAMYEAQAEVSRLLGEINRDRIARARLGAT